MRKKLRVVSIIIVTLAVIAVAVWYLRGVNIEVLNPKGVIGHKERGLMIFTLILGLAVIIPVFILTIFIANRYRETNVKTKAKAKYSPDWDKNYLAETIWWGIPIAIIVVLSVVTWISSHNLDPYKPLDSDKKQLTIQVVSLDWKWLFIYPEQNIATVNYAQFPVNTPIEFDITSDTVMNSFWIPQLGGQIYSMPGMSTKLHLNATSLGDYNGSSANISGQGFAGMKFIAKASSQTDFEAWVKTTKQSKNQLTSASYDKLAKPSKYVKPTYYSGVKKGLYDGIIIKYMMPEQTENSHKLDRKPATMPAMSGHKPAGDAL